MTPWTERLLRLVEQAPRPREWLFEEVQGVIPPGHAWRTREQKRRHQVLRSGYIPDPREPTEEAIRTGRRILFFGVLRELVRRGRLARYEVDGQTWIRYARDRVQPTHEQLSERARRGQRTLRLQGRRRMAEIANRKRAFWSSLSPEEFQRRIQHLNSPDMTPEQRSARSKKGWETRRERAVR